MLVGYYAPDELKFEALSSFFSFITLSIFLLMITTYLSEIFYYILFVLDFSCSMWTLSWGMWDLVPWPEIKPRTPALGVQSLSRWTTREVPWVEIVTASGWRCSRDLGTLRSASSVGMGLRFNYSLLRVLTCSSLPSSWTCKKLRCYFVQAWWHLHSLASLFPW